MANVNEIYGQIGAAKAFNSSVAYSLDLDIEANEDEIRELEQQYESTSDEKERKRINKRIKVLKRRNKMIEEQSKASQGATDFLTKICAYMDIGIDAVIKFIARVIVLVLPALEVSVKLLLLSKVKSMVGCSTDPRIPNKFRTNGVILNEAMIDPRQILKSNPYSKWGKYVYFGAFYDKEKLQERPTCELARAEDMNAFLWYAKNCAKFVSPNILGGNLSVYFDVSPDATLFSTHRFKGRDKYRFVEGSTFKHYSDSNTTFLCEKRELLTSGTYYTIVPATDRWTGINWYKDRSSITSTGSRNEINYDKSKPIFNIEYIDEFEPTGFYPDGNFRFRILPKPFSTAGGFIVNLLDNVHAMSDAISEEIGSGATEVVGSEIMSESTVQYKFQGIQSPVPYTARFNEKGVYDKRGRYSINTLKYYVIENTSTNNTNSNEIYFDIIIIGQTDSADVVARLKFNKENKVFYLESTNGGELDIEKISSILTECYTGNTIYEFNYDYIVSMKLFDAQEIAINIVDSLMNINVPNQFKKSRSPNVNDGDDSISNTDQIRIDSYVDKLVEKMIDTEEREFTDCFYTFSNKDYEEMEQEAADKAMNSTLTTDTSTDSIQEIYDIIDSYDADATLNERIETISLSLTKAANACGFTDAGGVNMSETEASLDENGGYATSGGKKKSIQEFIKQAVQLLTSAIVNAILTPKVLMLLQVNRMMVGTYDSERLVDNYKFSVEDLLNELSDLLKGVIREIIDTIQKELLRMILRKLSEMMSAFLKKLGLEYAMKWVLLLKQLLACFKRNKKMTGFSSIAYDSQYGSTVDSIIDRVDYADIDTLIDEIMPNTNPC